MNRGGSRRGHLSRKVPGAILRPASAHDTGEDDADVVETKRDRRLKDERDTALARKEVLDALHDADAGDQSAEDEGDALPPPLAGLIVCVTGIDQQRDTMAHQLQTLGARHERDLTDEVTHLIALRPGTAKYRCAVSLGMKVVTPGWLEAIQRNWLDNRPVDILALSKEHAMKPLQGLCIGVTALSDSELDVPTCRLPIADAPLQRILRMKLQPRCDSSAPSLSPPSLRSAGSPTSSAVGAIPA